MGQTPNSIAQVSMGAASLSPGSWKWSGAVIDVSIAQRRIIMRNFLITRSTHPAGLSALAEQANIRELLNPSRQELIAALPGVHAIVAGTGVMYDAALLAQAPSLLAIARYGVGLDNVDLASATERGICVLYTPQATPPSVAEHAVSLMLCLAKALKSYDDMLPKEAFRSSSTTKAIDLDGKILAVIGCGRIGSRVSRICARGLGMKVIVYDPYIPVEQATAAGAELKATLDEVLAAADVVSLHTPLTIETRHLISHEQLARMRPTAFLINTARGAVVDESALINALREGRIAGAGLDVFDPEPPASDNPLLQMPNVVVTPHKAGSTQDCLLRVSMTLVKDLRSLFRGERPEFLANPEVWERRRPIPQI